MTRYRVVPQKDGSYGVEITRPGEEPVIMNRFWTEAEADAQITTEQIRTAEHVGSEGLYRAELRDRAAAIRRGPHCPRGDSVLLN
jgi:hypothetical protein